MRANLNDAMKNMNYMAFIATLKSGRGSSRDDTLNQGKSSHNDYDEEIDLLLQ